MKCDINALKNNFPENFQLWTSQGEALLNQFGCDMVTVPSKNGVFEYLIGTKKSSMLFEAIGFIQSNMSYDEEKENFTTRFGKVYPFKKNKAVITGINGTGAIVPLSDLNKVMKSLKSLVNDY